MDTYRNDTLYDNMNLSICDKTRLINFIKGNNIIDVGCGDGSLMKKILKSKDNINITGIDADAESCERTKNNNLQTINCYANELHNYFETSSIDTIIASSIIHEIFSYGNRDKNVGKITNVKNFFKSAYDVLKTNGRFIIRDGVCPGYEHDVMFITDDNAVSEFIKLSTFTNNNNNFDRQIKINKINNGIYSGTRSSLMEFAYTYTWGVDHFYREAKEYYGVFTQHQMIDLGKKFGFRLIHSESYLQPGYVTNLQNVKFQKGFPDSNAIWVFEKE